MNLFKKPARVAIAEVLEDGRAKFNEEMKKARYNDYRGAEPTIPVCVRVSPEDGAPFEAQLKAEVTRAYLLKPGVRVQVRYDPKDCRQVSLDDDHQAIVARNPQLLK